MGAFASGSGPGVITEDGCAVEVYRLLTPGWEPDIIHHAIPAGSRILELGAGAGRVTHPLIRLGHQVVAVDGSAAMLAHVQGAQTVVSAIETLDLNEVFTVVLLGSHLVNVPEPGLRAAFLRCCRRHLHPDGCVLIERHAPEWFDTAAHFERTANGITYRLRDVRRPGAGRLEATMEYEVGGAVWTHSFRTDRVDDQQLATALHHAGLQLQDFLTDDGAWVRAVAASH